VHVAYNMMKYHVMIKQSDHQECNNIYELLAQRLITLVLIMINSCSYSTNDLVFNKFQIFNQNFNQCSASTKNSKSSFEANTC